METRDYANEPSPCQDGGEELMRTECACLGCMTERTSDFQKGSFTLLSWQPLRINFNAVDFVSPFLPSSFFLGFLCSSTHRHLLSCDDIRTDVCACGMPGPGEGPCTWKEK